MALLQVITSLKTTTMDLHLLVQVESTFSWPVLQMTLMSEVTTLHSSITCWQQSQVELEKKILARTKSKTEIQWTLECTWLYTSGTVSHFESETRLLTQHIQNIVRPINITLYKTIHVFLISPLNIQSRKYWTHNFYCVTK
jgi:hypothetical protein